MFQTRGGWAKYAGVALLLTLASTADAALSKQGSSEVAFEATATGGLSIEGTTEEMNVAEREGKVVITVPLGQLSTGISLRDKHMREKYLQVDKYPNAQLDVDRSSLVFPDDGSSVTKTVPGKLTLHGRTSPASFRYSAVRDGDVYRVAGAMVVLLSRHGIEQPSFMGITVKDEVSVRVRFEATDKP